MISPETIDMLLISEEDARGTPEHRYGQHICHTSTFLLFQNSLCIIHTALQG